MGFVVRGGLCAALSGERGDRFSFAVVVLFGSSPAPPSFPSPSPPAPRARHSPPPQRRRSKKTSLPTAFAKVDIRVDTRVDTRIDKSQIGQQRRKKIYPPARQTTQRITRLVRQTPRKPDSATSTSYQNLNLVQRTTRTTLHRFFHTIPQPSTSAFEKSPTASGAPRYIAIRNHRSERGSNLVAPKKDNLHRNKSTGYNALPTRFS